MFFLLKDYENSYAKEKTIKMKTKLKMYMFYGNII